MAMFRHRGQRNWGPRVREIEYLEMPLVTLENERLRVGVLAGKGADVVECNYKPHDLDFVWLAPGGVRDPAAFLSTSPDSLATFVDTYPGGWQEVFPNGGAPAAYFGAQFGQHGEVSNLPWDAQVVEDSESAVSVAFTTRALKTPFRLRKSLRLAAGESTVSFAESITNESDVSLPAMWGYHLAYGRPFLDQTCRVRLPEGVTVIPHPTAIHPDGRRVVANQRPSWPFADGTDGDTVDLSRLPSRGTISEIVYLTDFPEGWYELEHPGKGIGIRVEWDISVMPYLWYWMEFGASTGYPWYGQLYTIGLEPFSSYPTNGLPDAVANGSALRFGPREQKDYWLRATIYETRDREFNGVDTRG
jgi:uncharacterized protein DUF4432